MLSLGNSKQYFANINLAISLLYIEEGLQRLGRLYLTVIWTLLFVVKSWEDASLSVPAESTPARKAAFTACTAIVFRCLVSVGNFLFPIHPFGVALSTDEKAQRRLSTRQSKLGP